ncbi:hypothetical protein BB427_15770 [Pseudoalteromonas sp. BMB]|uniref:hypothetical protein n=1 Tax=Pseudoalteromonas sp. BMB TaxID=1874619 RepID=UPI00083D02C3|nr:hypothetical protein [Pseudoalteromonas sp. BMB]ODB36396.1 hypothetical protein BB427_15770 [Pseudoalteromonas sp. BMB]
MKKMSLTALFISSLALSGQAIADDFMITKEKQPSRMLVLSSAGGLSTTEFSVLNIDLSDIPYGSKTGTITGVSYTSAGYADPANETVELCFSRAYSTAPFKCIEINPNDSGNTATFNGEAFKAGISASIVHRVEATGNFHYAEPSRKESITFHYSTY